VIQVIAAWSAMVILLLVGGVHVYWYTGGRWPGSDDVTLARRVLPKGDILPPRKLAVPVILAFPVGILLLLAQRGILALPLPAWLLTAGVWGMAGVFLLRGVLGLLMPTCKDYPARPFFRLNRRCYSPLCLLLAAVLGLAAC
jgi:hypothetical protein